MKNIFHPRYVASQYDDGAMHARDIYWRVALFVIFICESIVWQAFHIFSIFQMFPTFVAVFLSMILPYFLYHRGSVRDYFIKLAIAYSQIIIDLFFLTILFWPIMGMLMLWGIVPAGDMFSHPAGFMFDLFVRVPYSVVYILIVFSTVYSKKS